MSNTELISLQKSSKPHFLVGSDSNSASDLNEKYGFVETGKFGGSPIDAAYQECLKINEMIQAEKQRQQQQRHARMQQLGVDFKQVLSRKGRNQDLDYIEDVHSDEKYGSSFKEKAQMRKKRLEMIQNSKGKGFHMFRE